jgi:hypothetical protein
MSVLVAWCTCGMWRHVGRFERAIFLVFIAGSAFHDFVVLSSLATRVKGAV